MTDNGESTEEVSNVCFHCKKEGKLQVCARCRNVRYCSVECQRADFASHKTICVPKIIEIDATMSFDKIQRLVNKCPKGGIVRFGPGTFNVSEETRKADAQNKTGNPDDEGVFLPICLQISKAITLIGSCSYSPTPGVGKETYLPFGIVVNPTATDASAGGKLVIRDIYVGAEIVIKENSFRRIEFSTLQIQANATRIPNYVLRADALSIGNCASAEVVLLDRCYIYGGMDGINNHGSTTKLHIKDCEIRFAECRGIFSNSHFIIEDSEVSNCGSYGIKDRAGRTMRGDNDIQPGPWDGQGHDEYRGLTAQMFGRNMQPW